MAPTVSSVNPPSGHSGGRTLVEILGTGFQLPPANPEVGPVPTPPLSVTVTFAGVAALSVSVVSDELLYVLTPEGDPDVGAVDVVVQNCDEAGDPVTGEVVTAAAAYTFLRPDLSEESELARALRYLMRSFKRQIHPNVVFTTHTDYDDSTGDSLNFAAVESVPAIVLANLTVPEETHYPSDDNEVLAAPGGRFVQRRPPLVVNITMTLVGVTNDPVEILNLMQVVRLYFKKNTKLTYPRDADDPSQGNVSYDIGFSSAEGVAVTHVGDNTNVESFSGVVTIYDVLLEDIPGLPRVKPAGIPSHFPHEATTGFGWNTSDGPEAVLTAVQHKAVP